jgi:hypothetical protein
MNKYSSSYKMVNKFENFQVSILKSFNGSSGQKFSQKEQQLLMFGQHSVSNKLHKKTFNKTLK